MSMPGKRWSWNALHLASLHGHEAIVKMLLENGADVNAKGGNDSALQMASSKCHEAIVKMLLEHGADVNAPRGEDFSALNLAFSSFLSTLRKARQVYTTTRSRRHREVTINLLLDNGAGANAH
jgi:ankyrin repeat protein